MKNLLTADNVKMLGRVCEYEGAFWSALSATGLAFSFSGRKLEITFVGDEASAVPDNKANYARVAVYVNNERTSDILIDSAEKTVSVIDCDTPVNSDVKIIKLSECAMSCVGIKALCADDEAVITPAAVSDRRIEIIGDSITCGYGVDDEDPLHHFFTATEDVTRAYAYKTAQNLGAELDLFSTSGYGIISGYTEGDRIPEQTIPQYYESFGFSYSSFANKDKPHSLKWDFSRFVPDIIVINLGTNDDSYCQDDESRQALYTTEYTKFLHKVRSLNPTAYILCTVGIMGQRIFPALQKGVDAYKTESGDEKISTLLFDCQIPEDGLVADYHPTETTHNKAAAKLTGEIKRIMNW